MLDMCRPGDSFGNNSAAQDASDGAEAGPGSIPHKPESGDSYVVRDGVLIRVPYS